MSNSWSEIFTRLFSDIIENTEKHIDDEDVRKEYYSDLLDIIREYDEDIHVDLMGVSMTFDEVILNVYPEAFDDYISDMEN